MADTDGHTIRRELLEQLYKLDQEKPGASGVWGPAKNDGDEKLLSQQLREAEYLQSRGWIKGTVGIDMFTVRITPAGRDHFERGELANSPPPPREAVVRRLGLEGLHGEILRVSSNLFTDGHYNEAILQAFIAVEVRVSTLTGLALIGQELMSKAFGGTNPAIIVKQEPGESGVSEQRGFNFLFMGAMAAIRNPRAHGLVQPSDPLRALEHLALASLLMHRLDAATVVHPAG